ncbi:hypothetical protein VTH8203_00844 [Vibrio thalassae]|uniref:Integrating conjugative element protein, PFL_4701 family n=1 Tax=Vibrio thalassae TaxID=1243014 RepID=A0A240EG43_9VIBR|nr:hypothetical protein [Vibrio thalassae]SNX47243.1 hypothetical protein VTH8203_00844 [Vibrio thalassae]
MMSRPQMSTLAIFLLLVLISVSLSAQATVLTPDPSNVTPEQAFNNVLDNNSWSNVSTLIKSVAAAVALIFTAWSLHGVYDATLVKHQITNKEGLILAVRMLVITTAFISLLSM